MDLIREKIITLNSVQPSVSSQPTSVMAKSEDEQSNNIFTKKVLPLSLIAGGGILIYYGVKGPNASKFLKKMVNDRISLIEKRVKDFADDVKGIVWEEFRAANGYLSEYVQARVINPKNLVSPLETSKTLKEIISAQDSGFEFLQKEIYKDVRAGATDFDNFTSFLYSIKRKVGANLNNQKHQINLANGDLIELPQFKNGKRKKMLENMSKCIDAKVKSGADEMSDVIVETFDKNIHDKSAEMAKVIIQKRDNFEEAKRLLIETSFAQVRQSLGLRDEFVPMYNKISSLDNFIKLTKTELRPHKIPKKVENIFNGSIIGDVLKTQDFSNLDDKSLRIIFLKMLHVSNLQDIGIMADRLRLRAVVEGNADMYRVLVAKLEFLQNKLQQVGEKELFTRMSQDFESLTKEQKRSRFAYINDAARKLGYNTLEQMDLKLSETHPEYLQMSFKKCIDEIKETPEIFFF